MTHPREIFSLSAHTIGGAAPAANCATLVDEVLGQSDGTPGQVFKLRRAPVLPRRKGIDTLLVGPQGASQAEMEIWSEVDDFSASKPDDRHFVCDSYTGEILLGPNLPLPNGQTRQYGAVPLKGMTLRFTAYRYGGGVEGNVREQQKRRAEKFHPFYRRSVGPGAAHRRTQPGGPRSR